MHAPTARSIDPVLPTLYGRDAEWSRVQACMASAFEGHGRLLVVGGEAGIGKSTLVEALAEEARARGALVLAGVCYDATTTAPYSLWTDIARCLESELDSPPPPAFTSDPEVFDQLGSHAELLEAIVDYLHKLASARPLLLILEDIHWADQESLTVLRAVVRRLSDIPALVVTTYRDVDLESADPLYRVLPELVREAQAERVPLRRLEFEPLRQLVGDRYGLPNADERRLADWLQTYSEGNPFFVDELLNTLEYESALSAEDGHWAVGDLNVVRVPRLVQQILDEQLARLDPRTVELLQVAAVIGSQVPFDVWQSAAGATDDELVGAIEQAQHARLLLELRDQSGYQFRHMLLREALYNSLVLPRRRTWHRRVAELLASQPGPDPDAVAHHFQQAADPRAATWLAQAGERAVRQFAWPTAADRFLGAARLLGSDASKSAQRAWMYYHAGKYSRRFDVRHGVRCLEEARRIAAQLDDRLLQGLATADLGMLYCIDGEIARGIDVIAEGDELLRGVRYYADDSRDWLADIPDYALPVLVPQPSTRMGIRINWLAAVGKFDEAIAEGVAYVEGLPRYPPSPHLQDAYDTFIGLGRSWLMLGKPELAREAFDRARAGHTNIEVMPSNYFLDEIRFVVTYCLDRPEERQRVDDMTRHTNSRRRMLTSRRPFGVREEHGSFRLQFLEGRWDDLEASLRAELARGTFIFDNLSSTLLLGELIRLRGDLEAASQILRSTLERYKVTVFGDCWFPSAIRVHRLAAELALDSRDFGSALSWIETLGSWIDRSGAVVGRAEYLLTRARYAELIGDDATAHEHLERALEASREPRQPLALLRASREMARQHIARSNHQEAEGLLTEALELAENCAAPFERARTMLVIAELEISRNEPAQARASLDEARGILRSLDAAPALAEADALVEKLSRERTSAPAPSGLSARETEVLRLVAQGLSDAEIGSQLFISRRTVSGHLQSIYNKLGVTSRTAAAAFAYRHGLI